MQYRIPDPKTDPIKALVIFYKITKNIEFDDRFWDSKNFARNMLSAKDLLKICGTFADSKLCLEQLSVQFDKANLSWTLETIVKHAYDWKSKQGGIDGNNVRARFRDALRDQRRGGENMGKGRIIAAGEILGSLGDLEVFKEADGSEIPRTDDKDERIGD